MFLIYPSYKDTLLSVYYCNAIISILKYPFLYYYAISLSSEIGVNLKKFNVCNLGPFESIVPAA